MTSTLYLAVAILVGVGAATQGALLAAMGRDKGPYEGTWINMLAAIGGLSILLVARGYRSEETDNLGGDFSYLPAEHCAGRC